MAKEWSAKRQKMVKPKNKSKSEVLSKEQKKEVQKIVRGNIETKTSYKTYQTATYNVNDDMLIMASDVFGDLPQGSGDSSIPGSGNRIGDSIHAKGCLFNFCLVARPVFNSGGTNYQLPWVNVRLMIFTAKNSIALTGLPTKGKCLDTQAMVANTAPTRIPFSNDNFGYIKDIYYNKVIKIRNDALFTNNSVLTDVFLGNEYYFNKYIKFNKVVKYTDNTTTPNQSNEPLYFCILAETAPFLNTGVVSGIPLLSISGYTKIYYKDA